ncbi:Hypothetical predicted protein [Mytilus galloprovincialis]|uniref:Uncharacterized protein n=1 Tax=Mytilus galloprovincialis TaxID=29158 RepID=A0A8B6H3Q5_MYTGA|nr:Hypothetical predicted protein [Mytilus galloprovincialis]
MFTNLTELALGNFTRLQTLDLSDNTISYIHPNAFNNLTDLRNLDLSDNTISYIHPNAFNNLTDLRNLNLKSNPLSGNGYQFLLPCSQLTVLYIGSNMLDTIDNFGLERAVSIRKIYCSYNDLRDINQSLPPNSSILYTVDFKFNNIEVLKSGIFANYTNLYEIYLHSNNISEIEEHAFEYLPNLRYL